MSIQRRVFADGNGGLIVKAQSDVSDTLAECARKRAAGEVGSSEMRHAMDIEPIFVEKYCASQGITFAEWMANEDHIKAMLRDPALSGFRIWEGKV
jgi:hypothetical protein